MSLTSLAPRPPASDFPARLQPRRLRGAPAAAALYAWLLAHDTDELPRLIDLAEAVGIASHYDVWGSLEMLVRHGRITRRNGTRSLHRGHQAIRILATGRVLKTTGCPFEPPERCR